MICSRLKDKFTHRHDRALVKAVQAQNLSKVKKAFAKGASADAIYDLKPSLGERLLPITANVHRREPVLLTAVRQSSLEIIEEVLKHKPDMTKRSWTEQSGVGKDSERTLTQEIIGDHLYGAAKDFGGAEKILAEEAASKRYTDHYALLAAKAKLLHKYLP